MSTFQISEIRNRRSTKDDSVILNQRLDLNFFDINGSLFANQTGYDNLGSDSEKCTNSAEIEKTEKNQRETLSSKGV